MVQVARRFMNDPRLFAFEITFNDSFLQHGPDNSAIIMTADYESPCDQVQYLGISRWLNLKNYPVDSAQIGKVPFVPAYSCFGNFPNYPYEPPPQPESESKHPPVEGWTVDLPQLWSIAKSHEALFANGLERCTITTVARLKEGDRRPDCARWTVFNPPPHWNGVRSSKPAERLANEQAQRAVIELAERPLGTSLPGARFGTSDPCYKGHYLIVDARTGADLDSGTYFYCIHQPI